MNKAHGKWLVSLTIPLLLAVGCGKPAAAPAAKGGFMSEEQQQTVNQIQMDYMSKVAPRKSKGSAADVAGKLVGSDEGDTESSEPAK